MLNYFRIRFDFRTNIKTKLYMGALPRNCDSPLVIELSNTVRQRRLTNLAVTSQFN
jgi:hypothetical protein